MNSEQKENLHKRIQALEAEIIERTRNYMYQHSLSKSRKAPAVTTRGAQTDPFLPQSSSLENSRTVQDFIDNILSPKKLSFDDPNGYSPCKSPETKIKDGVAWLEGLEGKEDIMGEIASHLVRLNEENEVYRRKQEELEKALRERQLQIENSPSDIKTGTSNNSLRKEEDVTFEKPVVQNLGETFEILRKALNESEEDNYRLRLENQQLRRRPESIEKFESEKAELSNTVAALKTKVEQMEVMKKEYLRAYSKVKEEKQEMEMRLNQYLQEDSDSKISRPLKTIEEHSDEHITEAIRCSSTDNSIGTVKLFLERSLLESRKQETEKWVSISIQKLDHFQAENQAKISQIHESYRTLVKRMGEEYKKQVHLLQNQFGAAMNKIIISDIAQEKEEGVEPQATRSAVSRRKSFPVATTPTKDNEMRHSISPSSKKLDLMDVEADINEFQSERERNWELMCKLSASQTKCLGLQEKYDRIVKKMASMAEGVSHQQIQQEFKEIMDKMIRFHEEGYEASQIQTNFPHLCSLVFQIIENLPIGDHGKIYFEPNSYEEMVDALNILLRFSESYDQIKKEQEKELKDKMEVMRKLIDEILRRSGISSESLVGLLKDNLGENGRGVSEFFSGVAENTRKEEGEAYSGEVVAFGKRPSFMTESR